MTILEMDANTHYYVSRHLYITYKIAEEGNDDDQGEKEGEKSKYVAERSEGLQIIIKLEM